jgi:putative transcriptional regulator
MSITINDNLRIIMAKRFLKLSQVAKETGISRTTLTNIYYSKNKMINLDTLDKLCKYFDCQITDILKFEQEN